MEAVNELKRDILRSKSGVVEEMGDGRWRWEMWEMPTTTSAGRPTVPWRLLLMIDAYRETSLIWSMVRMIGEAALSWGCALPA
jgi:hypothetical protein